jgi:hypothetical protein
MTGSLWTGQSNLINFTTQAITTTWTRYTFTVSVASTATQIGFQLGYTPSGTAGASDFVDITGVQIEQGSVATPFERRQYGQELLLCQRYYYRLTASGVYTRYAPGQILGTTTAAQANLVHEVPLRTTASAIEYSNIACYDGNAVGSATATFDATASSPYLSNFVLTTSGMTAYRPAFMLSNNTASSYVAVTAEL